MDERWKLVQLVKAPKAQRKAAQLQLVTTSCD